MQGDITQLNVCSRTVLRRSEETGDEYQSLISRCQRGFVMLAADEARAAIDTADTIARLAIEAGARTGSFNLRATAMWLKLHALWYIGDADAAWNLLREYLPEFARAGYSNIQPWATALPLFEGTAAVAMAQTRTGSRSRFLKVVDRCIKVLRGLPAPFASSTSILLAAGRAQLTNGQACNLYASAADAYEAQQLRGYAAAARARQAQLLVGPERNEVEQRSLKWFREQEILQPQRWTRMYAPVEPDG
jgi:hypothetical protein